VTHRLVDRQGCLLSLRQAIEISQHGQVQIAQFEIQLAAAAQLEGEK
jgi:hypothetical protein